ncbi:MAG: fibronectin type III domain-containing protein [Candidatus Firestonebacteria bacterium]|nr:fibronectin type III domain-containing protein [Candidatus Firestonebacteria bacterium]
MRFKPQWGLVLALWLCAVPAWARELTPLEKALKILAIKNQPPAAAVNTANAAMSQAVLPLGNTSAASAPTAGLGNTAAVAAAQPGGTLTAGSLAGVTATAKSAMLTLADALALTLNPTGEEVVVSWGNTAAGWKDFGGYLLLRGDPDRQLEVRNSLPLATNTYRDVSVTPKTMYLYQVQIVSLSGQVLGASAIENTQLLPSLPPEVPKNPQAADDEERTRILWTAVNRTSHAVAGYAVYRANTDGGEGRWINKKIITKTDFYDDTGEYGRRYAYQVAAVDAWGVTGEAGTTVTAYARRRSRNGLVLMSTAYRGFGRPDVGFNGDMQFTYYIGTLYGEQDKELSGVPLYLDPISLWLLTADVKYTALTDPAFPVAVAVGAKGTLSLFAGQQNSTGGSFTFTQKSTFTTLWGTYLALSRTYGNVGVHTGYMVGTEGNALYYLSKYLEPSPTRSVLYAGMDFPLIRRMNVALELLYPMGDQGTASQHPVIINTHVDRLLNFDISYMHWDRGWALLGYFNLRFTLFPGGDK